MLTKEEETFPETVYNQWTIDCYKRATERILKGLKTEQRL